MLSLFHWIQIWQMTMDPHTEINAKQRIDYHGEMVTLKVHNVLMLLNKHGRRTSCVVTAMASVVSMH